MLGIQIEINSKDVCKAYIEDLDLLIGGICGGKKGKHAVRLSGVKSIDEDNSSHISWLDGVVDLGDVVKMTILDDSGKSSPAIKRGEFSFSENQKKLKDFEEAFKDKAKLKPKRQEPAIIYENISYIININDEPAIVANVYGYESLQIDLMLPKITMKTDLKIASVGPVTKDGRANFKYWVDKEIEPGDVLKLELANLPDDQLKQDALAGVA